MRWKAIGSSVLNAGMDDYVSKPIRTNMIKDILRRWLPTTAMNQLGNQEMITKRVYAYGLTYIGLG